MNDLEIKSIQSSLGVELPDDYIRLVTKFPFKFGEGSCDYFLWDTPEKIISENLRLRRERLWHPAWFLLGDDGAGWQHVVNLREENPTVKDAEFEDIGKLHETGLTISEWVHERLQEFKEDGIDADSAEDPRTRGDKFAFWKIIAWLIGLVLIVTVIAFLCALLYQWIKLQFLGAW